MSLTSTALLHALLTHLAVTLKRSRFQGPAEVSTHPLSLQPHVGYSGVLFSLLTYHSLSLPTFAPVFFLPDLDFRTYRIDQLGGLPFNLGPFVLVFLISAAIPNASFTGHLAGAISGYLLRFFWGSPGARVLEIWNVDVADWYLWGSASLCLSLAIKRAISGRSGSEVRRWGWGGGREVGGDPGSEPKPLVRARVGRILVVTSFLFTFVFSSPTISMSDLPLLFLSVIYVPPLPWVRSEAALDAVVCLSVLQFVHGSIQAAGAGGVREALSGVYCGGGAGPWGWEGGCYWTRGHGGTVVGGGIRCASSLAVLLSVAEYGGGGRGDLDGRGVKFARAVRKVMEIYWRKRRGGGGRTPFEGRGYTPGGREVAVV